MRLLPRHALPREGAKCHPMCPEYLLPISLDFTDLIGVRSGIEAFSKTLPPNLSVARSIYEHVNHEEMLVSRLLPPMATRMRRRSQHFCLTADRSHEYCPFEKQTAGH